MDLQISVFLLFILFTAGHSLSCYECSGLTGSCADQKLKTCPSGSSQCLSLTTVVQAGKSNMIEIYSYLTDGDGAIIYWCCNKTATPFSGGITTKGKVKDCAVACQSGSMNFGISKVSTSCCNTDQCNTQDVPDPPNTPNGKQCFSCDEKSCSNTLSCSGTEDRCFKATGTFGGQSLVIKGCVSKSICDASSVSNVEGVSCCEGNLCNGAQSVTQSVLFLCCSLLSYFLMH
ncbi:phospholipase A2 inhibitor and Ly6/PLAUR domain-containing protein-like [Rhinichthys klamathensis goyatoka]|uniref:phospholipase A2 inhibitor and Ly6/PLAUR domain-containing protein-like n=1 Tax=Rhinichthys klamathensis goyatoka TaxID=3034132 RepID=UPI0024B601B1|nr:phospholipase A2 inhibitor and Ly6/PLAUR domain-containing protein-like [Rhinichthys klamathensis goyatoka]